MTKSIARICLIAALLLPLAAEAAKLKNHPAVTPYEGSVITSRYDDGHKSYTLVTGVNELAADAQALQTATVEGVVTRLAYENPKTRSAHEVFANYAGGLKSAGFELLFQCEAQGCGPAAAVSRWGKLTGLRYNGSDQRYLAAKAERGGKTIYAIVLVARLRHQLEIIEISAMETGLVTAKAIGEGLMREGRVILDGVYFDTDKTTLKVQSAPALQEIARFLKEKPSVNAFIVGHTDGTGSLAHNMALSEGRAKAVMDALVKQHGIAPQRLASYGVGPLSPRHSNTEEATRAGNRRVELVERTAAR